MSNESKQITLAEQWIEAKAEENAANMKRVKIEKEIVKELGVRKEGSKTHTVGEFKVEIKQPISRLLNLEKYDIILSENKVKNKDFDVTKTVRKLDEKKLKEIQKEHPDFYLLLSDALTVKPGKIGVKISV